MEEDVLNALNTRTAYLPGGYDHEGKIIIIVNIINDLQLWNRRCLELSVAYLKRSLSASILQRGVTVIVDAQKSSTRITRTHARIIYALFDDVTVNLYLVRAEGFWEKHVEPCTSKSQTKGEPIVLSRARLMKYFDLSNLPEELGGTLQFNYDLWLQQRKAIDEFQKTYEQTVSSMENLHVLLLSNKSLRPAEADAELKKCAQVHATVQRHIESVIEMGNRILTRLTEAYAPPSPATSTAHSATTHTPAASNSTAALASPTNSSSHSSSNASSGGSSPAPAKLPLPLPPDLHCERARIELQLNQIERKQTEIRTAWLELLQSIREARELAALEEGVAFVTNWILQTAEQLLSRQQSIGGDVRACETLRAAHDTLELECRETYGFYAELLYKIDAYAGAKDSYAYKDLMSQRDFMHFVCRSFATRLERRRNILITSLRFFRLVNEYFERTTAVFETLVMGNRLEDFAAAAENLQKLKESQLCLANMERELIKEGEKLSDMLAMPVKDALGRDLHIDYSDDICNVRDILDTTIARRNIFSDSVELQKLTLEQVTHIHTYELDAQMAAKWMEDLYDVMIRCHSHVGCNIHEIQVQKDELQTFQETGKSIHNYGCQLLEASQALRAACRLDVSVPQRMSQQLRHTWHRLQAISQEHMTRLRVSAVFHRSVEEYSQQLQELQVSVRNLKQTPNSSSGISSEAESQASPIDDDDDDDDDAGDIGVGDDGCIMEKPPTMTTATTATSATSNTTLLLERRDQLRKYLAVREQLLLEVGRMVRLGRLLKTRLKEPFVLDAATGLSVVVDDLVTDVSSPVSVGTQLSAEVDATADGQTESGTIVVNPTGDNDIACTAISNKLKEISEVAESLDATIRDVQNDTEVLETTSTAAEKKRENMRSNSSEDWHSRSTEDESFATASEGNFTPHSYSSSFQTASGRTSSYISSGKNSFDASEADDEAAATSSINMSFDSSEHSFLSAQQPTPSSVSPLQQHGVGVDNHDDDDDVLKAHVNANVSAQVDGASMADAEASRSQSVTPTPDATHYCSIPFDSETELESSYIAESPPMELLREPSPMTSVTPEVSTCTQRTPPAPPQGTNSHSSDGGQKPNAAWRRSKYYENITKQTIKGFL